VSNKRQRKKAGSFIMPTVGDTMYVPSMLYLRHGEDDFHGGVCRICRVILDYGPQDPFVEVEEWPGVQMRYIPLFKEQKKLRAEYGDTVGHRCPDTRPEFNDD